MAADNTDQSRTAAAGQSRPALPAGNRPPAPAPARAPIDDSFRRSESDLAGQLARAVARGQRVL